MENLFLLGQIGLGAYFVAAGVKHFTHTAAMAGYAASKGIPQPKMGVVLSGVLLLLGGLGVLFQMQLVWSYAVLAGLLVIFAVTMHAPWKSAEGMAKMADRIQFEKNLALAAALLMLLSA